MRSLSLALLTLCVTGCATTGPSAAQRRAAEIEAYRQRKATSAENETADADKVPAPPASERTRSDFESPALDPVPLIPPPPPPPVPAGALGPREGVYGLRASLLGAGLAAQQTSTSSLGFRYFASDTVSLHVDAGFLYSSFASTPFTGASLGLGMNVYGGTPGKALRPYFALQAQVQHIGINEASFTSLGASVGGGAEYWIAPELSVNATLAVGFATTTDADAVVLGTVQPGLGVTLFLD